MADHHTSSDLNLTTMRTFDTEIRGNIHVEVRKQETFHDTTPVMDWVETARGYLGREGKNTLRPDVTMLPAVHIPFYSNLGSVSGYGVVRSEQARQSWLKAMEFEKTHCRNC